MHIRDFLLNIDRQFLGYASLFLAITGLLAWSASPLFCGLPMAVFGAILGFLARGSAKSTLAQVSMVLCVFVAIFAIISRFIGN